MAAMKRACQCGLAKVRVKRAIFDGLFRALKSESHGDGSGKERNALKPLGLGLSSLAGGHVRLSRPTSSAGFG